MSRQSNDKTLESNANVDVKSTRILIDSPSMQEKSFVSKNKLNSILDSILKPSNSLPLDQELTKDIDPSLIIKPEIEYQKDYSNEVLLEKEKEVFGFYLSQHPTTNYRKDNKYCITLNNVSKYLNKTVDTLILVDKIKVINTKKGDKMAFITGSDETSTMEYTLFPKVFNNYPDIERGNLLKIRGNVERRLNQIQIIVDKIKNLKEDNNDKENNQ